MLAWQHVDKETAKLIAAMDSNAATLRSVRCYHASKRKTDAVLSMASFEADSAAPPPALALMGAGAAAGAAGVASVFASFPDLYPRLLGLLVAAREDLAAQLHRLM